MKMQVFPMEASQCISLWRCFSSCEIAGAGLRETEQFSLPRLQQHCKEPALIRIRKRSNCICLAAVSTTVLQRETHILPVFLSNTFCIWSSDLADTSFKKRYKIFQVRQLPGDYYTAADAEGHKLFLLRSTLPYTKKLSSWPFILSWLPHCEQVMNFYDSTTSHWSCYVPLGKEKRGGGKRSQRAHRHLKICPFLFPKITLNQMSQNSIWKLLQGLIIINVSEAQNASYERGGRMYSGSPHLNSYSKSTVSYRLASLEGTEPSNGPETYVEVSQAILISPRAA